jgi:ABC-type dipeptide/oligopeptide/nickel transport system permease component
MSIFKKSTEAATKATALTGSNGSIQQLITPYNVSTETLQMYSNTTFVVGTALTVTSCIATGVGIYRQHKKNKALKAELEAMNTTESEVK